LAHGQSAGRRGRNEKRAPIPCGQVRRRARRGIENDPRPRFGTRTGGRGGKLSRGTFLLSLARNFSDFLCLGETVLRMMAVQRSNRSHPENSTRHRRLSHVGNVLQVFQSSNVVLQALGPSDAGVLTKAARAWDAIARAGLARALAMRAPRSWTTFTFRPPLAPATRSCAMLSSQDWISSNTSPPPGTPSSRP